VKERPYDFISEKRQDIIRSP